MAYDLQKQALVQRHSSQCPSKTSPAASLLLGALRRRLNASDQQPKPSEHLSLKEKAAERDLPTELLMKWSSFDTALSALPSRGDPANVDILAQLEERQPRGVKLELLQSRLWTVGAPWSTPDLQPTLAAKAVHKSLHFSGWNAGLGH